MAASSATSFLVRVNAWIERMPRWLRVILGIVVAAVGVLVILRPFSSLTLLLATLALALAVAGLARIVEARTLPRPVPSAIAGVVEVLAAIAIVALPFLSVAGLAIIVGAVLIVGGVADLSAAWTRRSGHRVADALRGAALVIFGVLAILWVDVSLIVIAVVFAIRLVVLGIGLVVGALRRAPGVASPRRQRALARLDLAGRALLAVVAIVALAGSILLHRGVTQPTAFYDAPASVPDGPGHLIRSEAYTQAVPTGARGWLILYTTTDLRGEPTVGSAFVMAPENPGSDPLDVVLWTHGTQGADRTCAPTLLPEPLPLTAPMAAMKEQLAKGRVLVGPDYPGMGTAGPQGYLIGENEGRSSLDAVRAAHELTELELSWRTVVWGHSQGGQAALWTGGLAPEYAPEIELLGVSAAAPAADVKGLIGSLGESLIGQVLGPYAVRSYAETYDDVVATDYIDPRMYPIYAAASRRCIPESDETVTLLTAMTMHGTMYRTDPATGPLGERLDENVPTRMIDAPLFIAQGASDPLILPSVQEKYVKSRCEAGQELVYREYPGRDHLSVVADDSPYSAELLTWTDDRFAGEPAPASTCS